MVGGAESAPTTTYFAVKRLKHIERSCNFLTFSKYGFQTDLSKKFNFLLGVPLSGPLENVEIYFSKIDIKIFAIDTISLLLNRFIPTNKDVCKRLEFKQFRFDRVMNFSVVTGFFQVKLFFLLQNCFILTK